MLQEYAPLLKLVLIPTGIVVSCFILQKWLRTIVDMLIKLEAFVVSFNKASILLLLLYFILVAYVKLT